MCCVDIIGTTINVFIYKEISTYRKGSWKKIWWWSSSFSVGKLTSSWSRLKRNREHTNHLFYDSLKSDCLSVCLPPAFQQLSIGCWKERKCTTFKSRRRGKYCFISWSYIERNCYLLLVPLKFFYCVSTMTIFNAVFQFIIMSSNFTITRSNNT